MTPVDGLQDTAENVLIAYGMGWDLDGVMALLSAALPAARQVTIPADDYATLLKAQVRLDLLDAGGVDNWEYYGDAMNPAGEESCTERHAKIDSEYGAEALRT